ncbi:MAG: hypothetical protein M3N28_05615 [Actinomycetota bacterium]|nr:hypothetical protein [Actinomycetota bacterium]
MRAIRRTVAAGAVVTLAFSLTYAASAQVEPQPARVVYRPPGPDLTVTRISAFVSLLPPGPFLAGKKLYVVVTDVAKGTAATESVAATGGCQEVPVSFPGNGRYRVEVKTDVASPPQGTHRDCQGASAAARDFVVAVPAKEAAVAPKPTQGPAPAAGGGRGGARGLGGTLGRRSAIDVGRFEADFNKLVERAQGAQPAEEGFEGTLPYDNAAERDEELGTDEERGERRNTLAFMAGGLLALVTFLLLRTIRAEVDRQPLAG